MACQVLKDAWNSIGVFGSGSNGRIVLAETHDGVEVAVKVTLAMDGAQHEQRMLHHCLQYRVPVVEILDTFADKTVSVTVMKLEGTNWSLDNGVVYPLFAGLMHTRVVDKSRRVNVRDLYACLKMHTSFGGMPLHRIKHVFAQLVSAVAALHNVAGVSHGDLKLQNVLIDESLRVTIVDLSAAKFISEGHVKRFAGAPSYGSPEAMRGFAFSGPLNDIWSLGIMLYMLRYGADQEPSFTGIAAPLERRQLGKVNVDVYTWSKEHSKKHRLILPPRDSKDKLDDQLRDLLGLILQYDMSKRSSLEDIQCHPFLAVAGVGGAGVVERVDSGVCDLEAGRGGVRKQPFWHSFFSSSSEAKTGQV